MIEALQRFVGALRRAGLAVSPAEWLDALRAVERMGIEDRERFRQVLRATLVKRAAQRARFDETFDRFFVAPRRSGRGRRGPGVPGPGTGERRRSGTLVDSPSGRSVPSIEPRRRSNRAPRSQDEVRRGFEALRGGNAPRLGRLRQVLFSPAPPAPSLPTTVAPRRGGREATLRDLRRPLDAAGERELGREVRRLVTRIRLGAARRLRRTTSGRPYLRHLFRESIPSAGVPFRLPRRRRRRDTPRVVLLVDVSWSTARAAVLFLEIVREFLTFGRRARVLLFVDRVVDATEPLARWLEPGSRAPLAPHLAELPGLNLAAPSDYGRVFHQLLRSPSRPRGRRTVLVVLGDGRTNRLDPLEWAFAELAERCGTVLWLVNEPFALWNQGDSALGSYLAHADVAVEVRDLSGLGRGVSELVRRLG